MKAKALLLIVSFICAPSVYLFGQIDCSSSRKLICQLPVTSSNLIPTGGAAATAAATAASTSINAAIGTQLTQLPVPSASVGTVTLQKKGSEVGVPFANLGPVLTDRPDTVGKGHVFMGFSYQHFNFNAIDGVGLGTFPVAYTFPGTSTANGDQLTYYGSITNNIKFSLDQYVALMTIGLTRTTDVSVIVPVSQVTLDVVASNFQTYIYDLQQNSYSKFVIPVASVTTNGSATGLGDITINFKQLLIGAEGSRAAVAAGAQLRVPSGDELNYLGSGALGGNAYGLFEFRARLAPHLKVSYQWNNVSKLVNPSGGTNRLPGGLSYAAGADLQVFRRLTLAADVLGSQFVNSPSISAGTLALKPTPGANSVAPASLPGVNPLTTTYTTADVSTGLKWSPFAHLVLYGNVLMQINNVGLRSDPVPLFGISYNFKAKR